MARKPRAEEMVDSDEFEYAPVLVPVYRRRSDGNLYFVSDDGHVLDRYVRVVDSGGVAVVARHKGLGERLGRRLLRLGAAVLGGTKGLPVGIARHLLSLGKDGHAEADAIRRAVEFARDGDPRSAVLTLADKFGPPKTYDILSRFADDPRQYIYDNFLRDILEELREDKLNPPTPEPSDSDGR